MARTSFAKTTETAEPTTEAAQPTNDKQLATTTPRAVGAPLPQMDDISGAWYASDLRLPRINLVQKVSDSELVSKFGIGSFVLAKSVKLSDGTQPLQVTPLRLAKDYVQKVEFDSGATPAVFNTPAEVEAAGGSLNWKDSKSGNFFQERAHIQFIFAAPEGLSEEELSFFPYEDATGKSYAMALYTVASSAFTSVGKELITLRSSNKVMRQGLLFGTLALTSLIKKKEAKSWHVPQIKYTGATPAELVEFYKSLIGA